MAFDQDDQHRDKRALNRGYSDGMTRAFEIVLTPAIFAGFGWLLDRWLGLFPILTIVFLVFGVVGIFTKLYLGYEAEMLVHEDERRARSAQRKAAA